MKTWARAAVSALVLLAGVASQALAQNGQDAPDAIDRLLGRPVAAIEFEVEGRPVALPALNAMVLIKPGDPLRVEAVRDAESHLIASGYEDVQVIATDRPAGLVLLFRLTPRHPVESLQFRGTMGLPETDLARLLRDRFGGPPTGEQPEAVALALERLLQDEGYPDARVEPAIVTEHNPDRATLVLTVTAGRRSIIAATEVVGESPLSPENIRERTGTMPGSPFRRANVEFELAEIEDELREDGYYAAVALLAREPVIDESGVRLAVSINAGPLVTLRWDGWSPSTREAESLVPLARLRSVDEDLLEDSDARVVAHLQRLGYRDAKVTHTRAEDAGRLAITMHVDRGVQYLIDALEVTGNANLADDEVDEILAVRSGSSYDAAAILNGMTRLRMRYQQLGYYTVAVTQRDPVEVRGSRTATLVRMNVHVDVAEGPQARIGAVELKGVRPEMQADVRNLVSKPGEPYVQAIVQGQDEAEIQAYYQNLGFENVDVGVEAVADPAVSSGAAVNLTVTVTEGLQIFVGDITISGNERVEEDVIREQMALKEGQPFGTAARIVSQRQLYQLGLFRRVTVEEQPRASGETVAHVVVRVEELPPFSTVVGFGLEGGRQALATAEGTTDDRIFFAPRGSFQITRRNLWGKNRSIDFQSRVAPRPTTTINRNFGFLEYRVSTTYREPRAFHPDADLTLGVASEQVARTGFNYARRTATLQMIRQFPARRISVSSRAGLDHTRLFDVDPSFTNNAADRVALARLFTVGRLVPLASSVVWDRRDDAVSPTRGTLASADVQLTAKALGSEVGFAKVFVQASGYRAVSTSQRAVLAGRVELGLARGFPRIALDQNSNPVFDEQGNPVTVSDLPVSQRFFAGGSTTVRGFQLDRLGRPDVLADDGLSLGGNGVVVVNGELRTRLGRVAGQEFGMALFSDIGNVFRRASDIDFTKLRVTLGFGLRYNSPLGPVRLDLGFKTDRQTMGGRRERGWEYHLNIGEAF
jgi:outer membrane protein assembly complex protein YaeT